MTRRARVAGHAAERVPELRIRAANEAAIDPAGEYVLYWMTAFRRTEWNFSLQRAVAWAEELRKPLLVLEALRCDYRWASPRLHHFIIQGMADNAKRLKKKRIAYFPYVEPKPGSGKGLLAHLARQASVVVSDDFPCFFLPRMAQAAASQVAVRCELVDSNGILPLRSADKVFLRAHDFRRFLQKNLRPHLEQFPKPDPLAGVRLPTLTRLPAEVQRRWRAARLDELAARPERLARFPIDHQVQVTNTAGGAAAAGKTLRRFLSSKLARYDEARNQPQEDVSSGLSPYLHFGHISAHQVFAETMAHDGWSLGCLAEKASGSAHGWWGASGEVESFVDQLITWREVGYNMCWQQEDFDQFESLPDWAQKTLARHRRDRRPNVYDLEDFEAANTHDELWNAAQSQLVREGRIHNYLRMLWGKKILEWSPSPQDALDVMIELNNKYALDGRNPNSYSGIFWCLGRYDRPWGPERPVFGTIRYMSSENTARKAPVRGYIRKHRPHAETEGSV